MPGPAFPQSFSAGQVNLKMVPPPSRGRAWIRAAVLLNDLLADGQANAVAGIFGASVQAVENDEHALGVLGGYADTVIGYSESPFGSLFRR